MSNPMVPSEAPVPAGPRRWTWWGALLFVPAMVALQFAAGLLADLALLAAAHLGVHQTADWQMPVITVAASLSTLVLLLTQRRRPGAKPLWDSRDLRDWRGWALALAVLLGCAAANLLRIVASPDPTVPAINQEVLALVDGATKIRWGPVLAIGFAIVVLAPLTEEWFFRGILQQALGRWARWGRWIAVPVTAVIFGLMHGLDLWWVPAVYGLGIGLLANRQRSLALPMLVHGVVNLTVFLMLLNSGQTGI